MFMQVFISYPTIKILTFLLDTQLWLQRFVFNGMKFVNALQPQVLHLKQLLQTQYMDAVSTQIWPVIKT